MQARSIGYELKFPREVVDRAAAWIGTAWQSMPRSGGLFWTTTADVALRSIPESNDFSNLFAREGNVKSLWEATRTFHDLTRNGRRIGDTQRADLWRNPATGSDHDVDFDELNRDHKLNVTTLMLAANISRNIEALTTKGNLALPSRNEKDLNFWMTTGLNWWNHNNIIYPTTSEHRPTPFTTIDSVEYSVRFTIENAWRNLRSSFFEPGEENFNIHSHIWTNTEIPGLRWENTAICALDAVYNTIHRIDEAKSTSVIMGIAENLHKLMIKHKLWGNDTNNLDRSDGAGNFIPFDRLSKEMKENYILITMAALSGISDRMYYETVKLEKPTFASSPATANPPNAELDFALTSTDRENIY